MSEEVELKDRASLADKESVGYELAQVLYGEAEPPKKYAKNKKMPVNLTLLKSDLELLDVIAEHFGQTRSWLLSYFMSADIERMFDEIGAMNDVDMAHIARFVDREMSEKELEHDFKGATWQWLASDITDEINNPGSGGVIRKMIELKEASK